jgi:hypothetical protein
MMTTETPLRALPPAAATTMCEGCHGPIVWAKTVAGPNGPGGKWMPLEPREDLAGNVAVTAIHRGRIRARVLQRDESVDRPAEHQAQTHYAACPVRCHPRVPAELEELKPAPVRKARRRRGHR